MFNFLDQLIIGVEQAGLEEVLYNAFTFASGCTALLFNIWYGKKVNISFIKRIFISAIQMSLIIFIMKIILWIESGFTYFGANEVAVVFIFLPLIALLSSKILKIPYNTASDIAGFTPLVIHSIARMGCIFTGCCCGYPCSWGIYNIRWQAKHFPVQLLESALSVIIILVLLLILRKHKYNSKGFILPTVIITYGTVRFFTEFLHYNGKIWGGLSIVAFRCLLMFVVGILLLLIMIKRNKLRSDHYVSQKS